MTMVFLQGFFGVLRTGTTGMTFAAGGTMTSSPFLARFRAFAIPAGGGTAARSATAT